MVLMFGLCEFCCNFWVIEGALFCLIGMLPLSRLIDSAGAELVGKGGVKVKQGHLFVAAFDTQCYHSMIHARYRLWAHR